MRKEKGAGEILPDADFVLVLSASVTGIKGLSGLEFSGSIRGLKIAPALLAEGKFLISDYTFAKDSLFARINLTGDELEKAVGAIFKMDPSMLPKLNDILFK